MEVEESIHVPEGICLTVQPGSHIDIHPGKNITCEGEIRIRGMISQEVNLTCKEGTWGGIAVIAGGELTVDNTSIENAYIGIAADNAKARVNNTLIKGSIRPQIALNSSELIIKYTSLVQGKGIGLGAVDSKLSLIGSNIENNSYYGIYAHDSDISIGGTAIKNNGAGGMFAGSGSKLNIMDSKIEGNTGNGLHLKRGELKAFRSMVLGHTLYGIAASDGSLLDIRRSRITGNYYGGILVTSSNLYLENSDVENNYGNGITGLNLAATLDQVISTGTLWITESKQTYYLPRSFPSNLSVVSSSLGNNRGSGIYARGSRIETLETNLSSNHLDGLTLDTGCTFRIKGGNIKSNNQMGLRLYGISGGGTGEKTNAMVKDAHISHNKYSQLMLTNSDIYVNNSNLTGRYGVILSRSYITMEDCIISTDTNRGMIISPFSRAVLYGLEFQGPEAMTIIGGEVFAKDIVFNNAFVRVQGGGSITGSNWEDEDIQVSEGRAEWDEGQIVKESGTGEDMSRLAGLTQALNIVFIILALILIFLFIDRGQG